MVVGEGVRDNGDAALSQHGEEAFGVADAGDRVDAMPVERVQRHGATALQGRGDVGHQLHGPLAEGSRSRRAADEVGDMEIAPGRALDGFAQRTRWQQAAVAVAAAGVEDLDFQVAREAVVLQAVVADDDVAAGRDQGARRGHPIAIGAHAGTGTPRDQQR